MTGVSKPIVAVTRAVPGELELPGATIKLAGADQLGRPALLKHVHGCSIVISMFHDRIDDELLDAAGSALKGVCNFAVGVDNIDLSACSRRGIVVTNTPDAVTEGTANLAFGLLLSVTRMIPQADRFCREGRFEREGNGFPIGWCGLHLTGQTLLIVGAGRIGKAMALRAQAFGMRVVYAARSRHMDFEQAPLAAQRMELDEALAIADVVSVHTPLTPETRHIINRERLGKMKKTSVLINTSRGPTVDEAALAEALREGRIYGAGLDVFEREPVIHPELMGLENVVMTPHIGSAETYWREQMTRMVSENAQAILAGRAPANRV